MTAPGQGKWKLSIQSPSTNTSEPDIDYSFFGSREMALKFACQRRPSGRKAIRIEGPNGESMDENEIAEWCAALQSKKVTPPRGGLCEIRSGVLIRLQ
jgi:hypothetical protein